MFTDLKKHLLNYFVLVFLVIFFLYLFVQASGNPALQYRLSILASFSYFLWGLAHHYSEGNLNLKIMVEYGLLTTLFIIILRGIFL